jgi:plastocyanin domain-containing protein
LNKRKLIKLSDLTEGVYEFHCQMQMYKGVLEVKS